MSSLRKRKKRLLRWQRYLDHYPWKSDVKATPAGERAFFRVYQPRESHGHAYDGSDNPYAGPYGQLVLADMQRLDLY